MDGSDVFWYGEYALDPLSRWLFSSPNHGGKRGTRGRGTVPHGWSNAVSWYRAGWYCDGIVIFNIGRSTELLQDGATS